MQTPSQGISRIDLLVVIAVVGLLAVTQLPAVSRSNGPGSLAQCMNNLRQIGQASLLYRTENNDAFPYGHRVSGWGTGTGSVIDPQGWTVQFLRYLGIDTNQPSVYRCPSEDRTASGWVFQLHYMANRSFVSDINDEARPVFGYQLTKPSVYWLVMEKSPSSVANMKGSGFSIVLDVWNSPPGEPGMRRHNGGFTATACDGHVEWLRAPPFRPGNPAPQDMGELGYLNNGMNETWSGWPNPWPTGTIIPKKLFCAPGSQRPILF